MAEQVKIRPFQSAGGSVNPGPGTPMVMMSGVTAAWAASEDFGLSAARVSAMVGA